MTRMACCLWLVLGGAACTQSDTPAAADCSPGEATIGGISRGGVVDGSPVAVTDLRMAGSMPVGGCNSDTRVGFSLGGAG